jgi:hypothetical protein
MSTWYYYVNLTKKEYLCSLDIGYSLKEWPYVSTLLPLIGFLQVKSYQTNDGECNGDHTSEGDDDLVLFGHWAGDNCELVMEQTPIYDEIQEWEDKEGGPWINISHQVLREYNKNLDELSEFWLDDEEKKKLSIPVGPFGEHNKN